MMFSRVLPAESYSVIIGILMITISREEYGLHTHTSHITYTSHTHHIRSHTYTHTTHHTEIHMNQLLSHFFKIVALLFILLRF